MKYVMALVYAVIALIAAKVLIEFVFNLPSKPWEPLMFIIGITVFIIALGGRKVITKDLSKGYSAVVDKQKEIIETKNDMEDMESHFFAIAEEEAKSGEYDAGLWSQALVKADGEEGRRKTEYMKLRVKQLKRSP